MGFRWVTELFEGREGGLRDGLQRSYTRRFQVMTDDKRIGPLEIVFAPGIPRLYSSYVSFDTHEVDFFAICRDIKPTQDPNDWYLWTVVCTYDTQSSSEFGNNAGQPGTIGQPGTGGGSGASGDPTQEPPTVSWTTEIREVAFVRQANAAETPILNSAKQPFDPPPTKEVGFDVLRYSRNEATFDRADKAQYRFKMNDSDFLGAEASKVLCRPITADQRYIGPFKFWRVNYEFWFKEDGVGWFEVFLDQGLCQLDWLDNIVAIVDAKGNPVTQPQLLKDGVPLSKADIEDPLIGPQYIAAQKYGEIDFSPLNIVL